MSDFPVAKLEAFLKALGVNEPQRLVEAVCKRHGTIEDSFYTGGERISFRMAPHEMPDVEAVVFSFTSPNVRFDLTWFSKNVWLIGPVTG